MKHLDAKKTQKIPCGGFNFGQGIALQSDSTITAEPDTQIWCKMSFQIYATDDSPGTAQITKVYITDAEKNILFQTQPETSGIYALMTQAIDWMNENDRFYDFSFGRVTVQTFSDGRPDVITGYYPWIKYYDTDIRYQEDYADKTKIAIISRSRSFISPTPVDIRENDQTGAKTVALAYPTLQLGIKESIKTGTPISLSSVGMSANLVSKWSKPTA